MGIKKVEKKFDDLDGQELPDSTRAWRLSYQGRTYDVYLSKENRAHVEGLMRQVTRGAQRVSSGNGSSRSSGGAAAADPAKVREWLEAQGHTIGSKGRVPKLLLEQYEQAHREGSSQG